MTNVEKILIRMYVGLVYVLWSSGIKLGTAKLNATRQMKSFAETLDKSNPMTNTVKTTVQKMSQDVSRQIMTDKSSEMVLDKKYLQEYKKLGEKRVTESKQELMQEMARTKQAQRPHFKTKDMQKQSRDQNMQAREVGAPYCATNTNAPEGSQQVSHKLDQKKLLEMFWYNCQKVA